MKNFHAFVVGGTIMTMTATTALSTPMAAEGPAAEVSPLYEAADPGRGLPGATPSPN